MTRVGVGVGVGRASWLVLEEDGFDVFDVGVGGEAPDADVAATQVAVGVPVSGDGGTFVVYFFPIG